MLSDTHSERLLAASLDGSLAAVVVPSRRRLRRSPYGLGGSSITVQYQDSIWMLKYRHTARQDACRSPDTPSRRDAQCQSARGATNPNGRGLGSQIDDVKRGLATKSSTPCKTLVYLVVYPSLIHIITLKYARTLHKRRPRDARTNVHIEGASIRYPQYCIQYLQYCPCVSIAHTAVCAIPKYCKVSSMCNTTLFQVS